MRHCLVLAWVSSCGTCQDGCKLHTLHPDAVRSHALQTDLAHLPRPVGTHSLTSAALAATTRAFAEMEVLCWLMSDSHDSELGWTLLHASLLVVCVSYLRLGLASRDKRLFAWHQKLQTFVGSGF